MSSSNLIATVFISFLFFSCSIDGNKKECDITIDGTLVFAKEIMAIAESVEKKKEELKKYLPAIRKINDYNKNFSTGDDEIDEKVISSILESDSAFSKIEGWDAIQILVEAQILEVGFAGKKLFSIKNDTLDGAELIYIIAAEERDFEELQKIGDEEARITLDLMYKGAYSSVKKMDNIKFFYLCDFSLRDTNVDEQKDQGNLNSVKANDLLGNWEYTKFISESEFNEMAENQGTSQNTSGEITIEGKQTFLRGGRYSDQSSITIRFTRGRQEIPMAFVSENVGTWEIHDKFLVIVSEDSKLVPINEFAKKFFKSAPEIIELLQPLKGRYTSYEIITLMSENLILKSEENGMILSFERK